MRIGRLKNLWRASRHSLPPGAVLIKLAVVGHLGGRRGVQVNLAQPRTWISKMIVNGG